MIYKSVFSSQHAEEHKQRAKLLCSKTVCNKQLRAFLILEMFLDTVWLCAALHLAVLRQPPEMKVGRAD